MSRVAGIVHCDAAPFLHQLDDGEAALVLEVVAPHVGHFHGGATGASEVELPSQAGDRSRGEDTGITRGGFDGNDTCVDAGWGEWWA